VTVMWIMSVLRHQQLKQSYWTISWAMAWCSPLKSTDFSEESLVSSFIVEKAGIPLLEGSKQRSVRSIWRNENVDIFFQNFHSLFTDFNELYHTNCCISNPYICHYSLIVTKWKPMFLQCATS
jgi:hypothetical protein